MFEITFRNVEKRISKSVKPLKSKKGHSLHEADKLLKEVYKIVDGKTKLTIVLKDMENELNYIFEDILMDDLKEPNLLEILEMEILSSGNENAQKIIAEIQRSYQDELYAIKKGKDKKSNGKRKKKKFGFLKLFKKKKEEGEEEKEEIQSPTAEDFAELVTATSVPLQNDFQEMDEEKEVEENNENEVETSFNNVLNTNMESENENQELENEYSEVEVIADDFNDLSGDQNNYSVDQKEISPKKNDMVAFPEYYNYLDLSQVEDTIKRIKNRFDKLNLIKLLGLNNLTTDTEITQLDKMKLNYALNKLDSTKFTLLKDQIYNNIENAKDEIQSQLAGVYEHAMMLDYEGKARKNLEEEFNDFENETENIFNEYVNEQENEYELKLEKFIHEQEKALEEFKKQQNLDREMYIKKLDTKKSAKIELYKDNKQKELDVKKEEILDNKMLELKNQYINQLVENKRVAMQNLKTQLNNIVDEGWKNVEGILAELKKDIEKNIPSWKKDIKEKQEEEAKKREEERKQEELRLEKERIDLQKRQLELKTVKEEESKEDYLNLVQKKFEEYEEKLNNLLKQQQETLYYQNQNVANHNQNQGGEVNKENKGILNKIALPAIIIAILVLGTGMFVGHSFSSDNSETVAQTQYEELAESISTLEEKINNLTVKQEEQTTDLDTLLKEKNYEKAMTLYKDPESLKKIEETLYQNGDLAMLITFNKTNETAFGKIDEAILSKDIDKAMKIYNKMPDDKKEELSSDKKSDLALLLYQKGEKDLANKLLEK